MRPAYFIMAALAFVAMFVAILGPNLWFLTWVHIMAGVLWTGIDLFLGFVIGPILRRLPFETRRTVIGQLIPKTMVLMPTLVHHHRHRGLVSRPAHAAISISAIRNSGGWRRRLRSSPCSPCRGSAFSRRSIFWFIWKC